VKENCKITTVGTYDTAACTAGFPCPKLSIDIVQGFSAYNTNAVKRRMNYRARLLRSKKPLKRLANATGDAQIPMQLFVIHGYCSVYVEKLQSCNEARREQ
jgi:hypothetical protein